MTFADLLPAFDRECFLMKLSQAVAPKKAPYAEKVDAHHQADVKDWDAFQKNMKNKKFRMAVFDHPMSDDKLKAYVKANGEYQASKDVVGLVPSLTSSKMYKIKRIGGGRLACSCKDWHYSRSHKGGNCRHIKELAQGLMEKVSARNGKCLGLSVRLIRDDPTLTLMMGPPDRPCDTRHFWVKTAEGKIVDPSRKDYPFHSQGTPVDLKKNPGILKVSSIIGGLASGVAMARTQEKSQKTKQRGKTMKGNVTRLHLGMPLAPIK